MTENPGQTEPSFYAATIVRDGIYRSGSDRTPAFYRVWISQPTPIVDREFYAVFADDPDVTEDIGSFGMSPSGEIKTSTFLTKAPARRIAIYRLGAESEGALWEGPIRTLRLYEGDHTIGLSPFVFNDGS